MAVTTAIQQSAGSETHRRPVGRQQEQQQEENADASKRDELLGTLAGVQGEPRHEQSEDHHDEDPAQANHAPTVCYGAQELRSGIKKM